MLNIPSSVDDPSYRYKMPRLVSRKEGRGNGSKTGILNMGDVSRALKRDPVYITKFIGYELGAQSSYTNKENEGERVVINGHHDTPVFQNLVDKFIERYVLCTGCNLPEIDMVVRKGFIVATCKACGWNGELDNQHKLAGYIVKNPPSTGIGFDGEGGKEKKSRQERQAERMTKAKKKGGDEEEENEDDDDDEPEEKAKKDKKDNKEKKEKKSKKEKEDPDDGSDDESKGSDSDKDDLKYGDDDVKVICNDLTDFVKSKGGSLSVDLLFEEIRAQQVTKVFDNRVRMYVLVSALFPGGSLDAKGATQKKAYIKRFISNGNMSFKDWIWGFEAYLDTHAGALKAWPMTIKALYDEDLAEEEHILAYYKGDQDSPGFEAAKKACAPFVKWLETTDDSDDDDDDSDEDSDSD